MVGTNRQGRPERILRFRPVMKSSFSNANEIMRCRDHFTVVKRLGRPLRIVGESESSCTDQLLKDCVRLLFLA